MALGNSEFRIGWFLDSDDRLSPSHGPPASPVQQFTLAQHLPSASKGSFAVRKSTIRPAFL